MNIKRKWLYACTALGAIGGAGAPIPAAAQAGPGVIEEVIVTARRREENLQTVPIAISAFSGEQLREKAITTGEQLQHNSPNLTVLGASTFGHSAASYSLRGQSVVGTIVYRDDVPQSSLAGANVPGLARPFLIPFYDLQSVQVAHGPQGTLYGRNTTGGAIIITSKRPSYDFNGYVLATAGNYDLRDAEGAVNVPLIEDKLAIRVVGKFSRRDGYTTNLATGNKVDDNRTESARVSLLFEPTDRFTNLAMYEYFNRDDAGGSSILIACNPLGSAGAGATVANGFPVNYLQACNNQIRNLGARKLVATDPHVTARQHLLVNTTTLQVSDQVTFKNIFGYRTAKSNAAANSGGTIDPVGQSYNGDFAGYFQGNARVYTDEFQVQGDFFDGDLTTIAGFYYERDSGRPQDSFFRAMSLAFTPFSIAPFTPLPPGSVMAHVATRDTGSTKAAYAQFSFKVRPSLTFTAGYRYSWDAVKQANSTTLELFGRPGTPIPIAAQLGLGRVTESSAKTEGVNLNFSLDYQVDPETLLYITYRRGYRPGGFNTYLGVPPNPALSRFGPEDVLDTEVGVKKDFNLGGVSGRVNGAAFYDDYKGVQRFATQGISSLTQNAESATVKGVELEGRILPASWLELSGHYAYLDAKFNSFRSVLPPFNDMSDSPFSLAPKHNWAATALFRLPTPEDIGRVTYSVTLSGRSSQFLSDDKYQVESHIGGYKLVNMRLDWKEAFGSPVDIGAFINNVTNKTYILGTGLFQNQPVPPTPPSAILGYASVMYGEPRMYGLELRYSFGAR